MAYERQTAKICRIGHLAEGNYVQKEGWDPNYVETCVGDISRANIIAIVVGKEGNTLMLDDASGRISLRSFEDLPLTEFNIGDRILVICRPRVYNNEMFLAAEIVRKLENDKWLEHRKLEIKLLPEKKIEKIEKIENVQVETKITKTEVQGDDIITVIKNLDKGDGADVGEIIKHVENGEKVIQTMMEDGDVFEIKPGRVKVLD